MESRTYEQRHARALEMLDKMMAGAVDPAEMADTLRRRHGALGGYAIDVVLADVWARPELSRRDRSLIVLAVLSTIGSTEELSIHTQIGLNNGLSRSEIEEVLLHIAAYAGFPIALQASRVIDARLRLIDGVEQLPDREAGAALSDAERRVRAGGCAPHLDGRPRQGRSRGGHGGLDWAFRRGRADCFSVGVWRCVVTTATQSARPQSDRDCDFNRAQSCRRTCVSHSGRSQPWPHTRGGRRNHGADDHLRRYPACRRGHTRDEIGLRQAGCATQGLNAAFVAQNGV